MMRGQGVEMKLVNKIALVVISYIVVQIVDSLSDALDVVLWLLLSLIHI